MASLAVLLFSQLMADSGALFVNEPLSHLPMTPLARHDTLLGRKEQRQNKESESHQHD